MLDLTSEDKKRSEEEKFSSWLEGVANPANELLKELQTLKEVESLTDRDRIAEKIQNFYHVIEEIIRTHDPRSLKLSEKPGVVLQEYSIALEDILAFSIFCLAQDDVSQVHVENLNKYSPYISTDSKDYRGLKNLESALAYLKPVPRGNEEKIPTSPVHTKLLFLKEFIAHLEYVSGDMDLFLPEGLMEQLNQLLFLVKQEGDAHLKQDIQQDEFEKTITTKMGKLPSMLEGLLKQLASRDISMHSADQRRALIAEFETEILNVHPDLSDAMKKTLESLVAEAPVAVDSILEKFSCENFSQELLRPLVQQISNNTQLDEEIKNKLIALKDVFNSEINRLFIDQEESTSYIGSILSQSIFQVVDYANSLKKNDPSFNQKKQELLRRISLAHCIFQAKKILNPLERAVNKLDPSFLDLNKELRDLQRMLRGEIQSRLLKKTPLATVEQQFAGIIAELEILTQVVSNRELTKDERLRTIQTLKNHVEEQYSIFPATVIQALRRVIGAAQASLFVDKVESMASFFKLVSTDQRIKKFTDDVKSEISKLPNPSSSGK